MEENESKIEKLKNHIKRNKKIYIGTGIGLIIGAVGTRVYLAKYGVSYQEVIDYQVASIKANIKGHNNTICQTISVYGNPLGRPGNPVVDTTTGHRYESIKLAASDVGVNYDLFRNQLNAGNEINGHKFIRLIEDV